MSRDRPKTFQAILAGFGGDIQKAWEAHKRQWIQLGLSKKLAEMVDVYKNEVSIKGWKQRLAQLEIGYLSQADPRFPKSLIQIADCPIGLFIKGSFEPIDARAIAVVGTRKVTEYGREVTSKLVTGLIRQRFTIVSGLARGVDGIAHKICVRMQARTIAVLGCGLDTIYPPEHRVLAREITQFGALVSEYPPGVTPHPGHFPARNRIIAGMSLGVLVTEGASHSGSKITAHIALEQNREVFAVPGPITSPMSSAPAELIQAGAKLVLSEHDIVRELHLGQTPMHSNGHHSTPSPSLHFTHPSHQTIWEFLIQGSQHVDEIVRATPLSTTEVAAALSMMEIQGQVRHLGAGKYMVV